MKPTASSLSLLPHCQWWARDDVSYGDDIDTPARRFGNAAHALLEKYINTRTVKFYDDAVRYARAHGVDSREFDRLATVTQHVVTWLDQFRASLPQDAVIWSEMPFAWDVETGKVRVLPAKHHRDYSDAKPSELCGTADFVVRVGDTVIVGDLKTGHSPAENYDAQMQGLGFMAARYYGVEKSRVIVLKVDEEGTYPVEKPFNAFDLASIEATLESDLAKVPTAEPQPGLWCQDCHAVGLCPATLAAADEVTPEHRHLPIVAQSVAIQSPKHAAYIYERIRAIDKASEQVWEALDNWMRVNGPIPLGFNKEYAETQGKRTTIDGKAALALAEKMGAPLEELGHCMKTTTFPRKIERKAS